MTMSVRRISRVVDKWLRLAISQRYIDEIAEVSAKDLSFDNIFGNKKRIVVPTDNLAPELSYEIRTPLRDTMLATMLIDMDDDIDWVNGIVTTSDGKKRKLGKLINRSFAKEAKKFPDIVEHAKKQGNATRKFLKSRQKFDRTLGPLWREITKFGRDTISDISDVFFSSTTDDYEDIEKVAGGIPIRMARTATPKAIESWGKVMGDLLDMSPQTLKAYKDTVKEKRKELNKIRDEIDNFDQGQRGVDAFLKLQKLKEKAQKLQNKLRGPTHLLQLYDKVWDKNTRKHNAENFRNITKDYAKKLNAHRDLNKESSKILRRHLDDPAASEGDRMKATRLIKELPSAVRALQDYEEWKGLIGKGNLSIVVSRAPIDVLRMSDHPDAPQAIESCHSQGGSYFRCAIQEAKGHGLVAYVVNTKDLQKVDLDADEIFSDKRRDTDNFEKRKIEGIQPYARIRLRRYENKKDGSELAIPETVTYGAYYPNLVDEVTKWAREAQKDLVEQNPRMKDYRLTGGEYRDSSDAVLWNNFLGTDQEHGNTDYSPTKQGPQKPLILRLQGKLYQLNGWDFTPKRSINGKNKLDADEVFELSQDGTPKQKLSKEEWESLEQDPRNAKAIVHTVQDAAQGNYISPTGKIVMDWGSFPGDEKHQESSQQEQAKHQMDQFWDWLENTRHEVPNPNPQGRKQSIAPSTLRDYMNNKKYRQSAKQIVKRYWNEWERARAVPTKRENRKHAGKP